MDRNDNVEPMFARHNMDKAEPTREKLRKDREEPKYKHCCTENCDPLVGSSPAVSERVLPMRQKLRNDTEEPRLVISKIAIAAPNLA